MFMSEDKKNSYGADAITVLEGLDPVRKRPGMYIGSTSAAGLHHLIWEVVDNCIDEAMAGHANEITVILGKDNMVSVTDNGRGIPVEKHKVTGVSALETVLTKLHAGGKFGGGGYKVSGGLHGVGVSVVNALSTYLRAEIKREGVLWAQEYKTGIPQGPIKKVGTATGTGTTIIFQDNRHTLLKELLLILLMIVMATDLKNISSILKVVSSLTLNHCIVVKLQNTTLFFMSTKILMIAR